MKILVVRFSSIGDIVLTTPVVRCLYMQVPNAEIHYATKAAYAGIVASNPYVHTVHTLNDDFDALVQQLELQQFDAIVDLHHNTRTFRLKRALKQVPSYSFEKLNLRKWLYTALKINTLPPVHIVDRYLATTRQWNVVNDGKGLDFFIDKENEVPVTALPLSHMMGYVGVVVGAALGTKQLPLAKLQALCAAIHYPIILLGGKEDVALAEAVKQIDDIKIYNACGKFNLQQSAFLVKKAKKIYTHDTGLMHIAAAFQKPIVSIWGNTTPAFGMQPYYGANGVYHQAFEVNTWCRPCSKIGYKKCPLGHFNCMNKQDVERIAKS
jgi:ADP-heptose:LPS heptosyltransferase